MEVSKQKSKEYYGVSIMKVAIMYIIPDIFKYNLILSVPIFLANTYLLLSKTKGFSYSKLTVSRSIYLFNPAQRIVFRLNFVVKALVDFGFIWYLAKALSLSITSPLIILWIVIVSLFGSFAYFTDERGRGTHELMVYTWIALWLFVEFLSSLHTQNFIFIWITSGIVILQSVLAFGSRIRNKTNAIIQIICVLTLYVWLVVFVFVFL